MSLMIKDRQPLKKYKKMRKKNPKNYENRL